MPTIYSQADAIKLEGKWTVCVTTHNFSKPRTEWAPKKNESNKEKQHIGFESAQELLPSCYALQEIVEPGKWKDISEEALEAKGIGKNFGNLNPLRSRVIGLIDEESFYMYLYIQK